MTALLEAKRQPQMQQDLQAAMIDVWGQLDHLDAETKKRILARVAEIRAEILDRLAALPTTTDPDGQESWQTTSLRALDADLRELVRRWSEQLSTELGADLQQAADLADVGYRDALSQLARAQGVPAPLIRLSPIGVSSGLVQAATLYNASAFRGLGERIIAEVNREIQRVAFGGQSRWDAIRNIREHLAADPRHAGKPIGKLTSYATMVERTALMSVFNAAAEHAYREAAEELPDLMTEWVTVKDSRVDAACVALGGTRKKPGQSFAPGVIAPPLHPRCLVAGTVVASPRILATTTRGYTGEVVEIRTVNGHVLTVTPNHPILTPHGWIAAGLLDVGRHVISSTQPEWLASTVSPDHYQSPAVIEEIASSFNDSGSVVAVRMPTTSKDFHGDGWGSKICVVRADRQLWNRLDAAISEPSSEQLLHGGDVQPEAFASLSGTQSRFAAIGSASLRGVSSLDGSHASFRGAAGLLKAIRFSDGPPLYTQPLQGSGDSLARDGIALAQTLLRLSVTIETDQLFGVWGSPEARIDRQRDLIESTAQHYARLAKTALYRATAHAFSSGQLTDRRPSLVARDEIVEIRWHPEWSGQVYNLETSLGWYIASGIVTHNCRCRTLAWMPGWASLGVA